MINSKWNKAFVFYGKIETWLLLPLAIVAHFTWSMPLPLVLLLLALVIAPVVETLIFQWPWLRWFKGNREGVDYPVWITSVIFGLAHLFDRLALRQTGVFGSQAAGTAVALASMTLTFVLGLWLARGCRMFLVEGRVGDAFYVTVGRHGFWNFCALIISLIVGIIGAIVLAGA